MTATASKADTTLRNDTEWQLRVDLAACYRAIALHGWDDLIFTHISARLPGPEHHFLINPYGLLFEEITASSLVKIGLDGEPVEPTDHPVNPAGFTIHSAIHEAREDARCVIHLHTDQGLAVAAQKDGLLPLSQTAMVVRDDLAYHDYEGIALEPAEKERLVADLGDRNLMILRNHGTLAVGQTIADAYLRIYFLERGCRAQTLATGGGADLNLPREAAIATTAAQSRAGLTGRLADMAWGAVRRRLDRELPGYDA